MVQALILRLERPCGKKNKQRKKVKACDKARGLLLSLIKMMFLLMTVYFPSFLSFSGESGSD